MTDKIVALLKGRGEDLYQEDGLLTEKEFQILREIFLPGGKTLCYVPSQKPLGRKRRLHEVNPTLRAAASRLSSHIGVIWGYVDAYVSGLAKLEEHIEAESGAAFSYTSREQRRKDSNAHWRGLD